MIACCTTTVAVALLVVQPPEGEVFGEFDVATETGQRAITRADSMRQTPLDGVVES